MTDYFFRLCPPSVKSTTAHWTQSKCTCSPNRQNRNVIFWLIVCKWKESQITSGSLKKKKYWNTVCLSFIQMQVHVPKKILVHYKDKCWKKEPSVPTVFFSSWHTVKPNYWSFTRCWAAFLSMGCHSFIDTSHVFLICNCAQWQGSCKIIKMAILRMPLVWTE